MSEKNPERLTFASLDEARGIVLEPPPAEGEFPLPAWFRAVREIPIGELGVEDICKACRQQVYLEYIVPRALQLLTSDPLAGEMYDGELLSSLKAVPVSYWSSHDSERLSLKPIIESALNSADLPESARQVVDELRIKVAA